MISTDLFPTVIWWLVFLLLGAVAFPITWRFFKKFADTGYGLSKIVGLVLTSYLVFLFSSIKIIPFTTGSVYLILAVLAGISYLIHKKHKGAFLKSLSKNKKIILIQEIAFTIGFVFWTIIRGYQPAIRGLEKFMDLGFINSIINTKYLPPVDMWFAGESINYYWFGHLMTAVATRLSGVPTNITFNLMIATILGLTLSSCISLVATLIKKVGLPAKKSFVVGLVSAVLLVFAGNFHAPIFSLLEGVDNYWYPDATRFIGYNPDVPDKTIHEFPIYSFVVSDLHAHLLDLFVVMLFLSLAWNFTDQSESRLSLSSIGFILGIMFMTNAWDFGVYSFTFAFIYLIKIILDKKFKPQKIATDTALVLLVTFLTTLPFLIEFKSIAQGVDFVNSRSALWQLAVLWGFPALLTLSFLIYFLKDKKLKTPDYFVGSLLLASWLLIFIPEIIYVKDIYIASHHRANTMFKLTYQAFVMFYLTSGYIFARSYYFLKKKSQFVYSIAVGTIVVAIMMYPVLATKSFYGGLREYKGLSGESWIAKEYPDEYAAILWLRSQEASVILEAQGDSYTDYNLISTYTGYPTVAGWFVHEWLWRGDSFVPQRRSNDVQAIYETDSTENTNSLLQKYDVNYVVIGKLEREKYSVDEDKFTKLGKSVFSSGDLRIYKINQ